jgi:three-Cys-motif partner protein
VAVRRDRPIGRDDDEATDDGLCVRQSGRWALDKLGILSRYVPQFGRACRNKAPAWYYAEGFAGPGVNLIRQGGRRVRGSPLIALEARPAFRSCVFIEASRAAADALRQRTARFGDRAHVMRGDCNRDLLPLMAQHINRHAPCLAVLDPEGADLAWSTLQALARFKARGRSKVEQLILFPTNTGFIRLLPINRQPAGRAVERLDQMFGGEGWKGVYADRVAGRISPSQARDRYLAYYQDQLRGLGYRIVLERAIRRQGWGGAVLYFLVFATDNPAGERIMDSCFDHVENEPQATLPGITAPRRRYGH